VTSTSSGYSLLKPAAGLIAAFDCPPSLIFHSARKTCLASLWWQGCDFSPPLL
jgi:hypothetical protein